MIYVRSKVLTRYPMARWRTCIGKHMHAGPSLWPSQKIQMPDHSRKLVEGFPGSGFAYIGMDDTEFWTPLKGFP